MACLVPHIRGAITSEGIADLGIPAVIRFAFNPHGQDVTASPLEDVPHIWGDHVRIAMLQAGEALSQVIRQQVDAGLGFPLASDASYVPSLTLKAGVECRHFETERMRENEHFGSRFFIDWDGRRTADPPLRSRRGVSVIFC